MSLKCTICDTNKHLSLLLERIKQLSLISIIYVGALVNLAKNETAEAGTARVDVMATVGGQARYSTSFPMSING